MTRLLLFCVFFPSLICIFGEWPTDSLTWTTFSRVDLLVACHFHLSFRFVAFVWALNWLCADAIAAAAMVVLIEGRKEVRSPVISEAEDPVSV